MTKALSPLISTLLRIVLLIAAVATLLFVIEMALNSATGQQLDQRAMNSVRSSLADPSFMALGVLGRVSITIGAILAAMLIFVRLAVRDLATVAVGLAVFFGSNVTTQVLKNRILDRPEFGFGGHNSLPSGHTTIAAALGAVVLISLGAKWRPAGLMVVATLISLTGLSTVIAGWHRPSDVMTALLVTFIWAAGMSVFLGPVERRRRFFIVPGILASVTAVVVLAIVELSIPTLKGAAVLFVLGVCVAVFASLVLQIAPKSAVRVARPPAFN